MEAAGLTAANWNVAANILNTGPGTIKTLRVSAFSSDGMTPLNGSGTLYNLRMLRVGSTPGASTALTWAADPDNFFFIDTDLNTHAPAQDNGLITITGAGATPQPVGVAAAGRVAAADRHATADRYATAGGTAGPARKQDAPVKNTVYDSETGNRKTRISKSKQGSNYRMGIWRGERSNQ